MSEMGMNTIKTTKFKGNSFELHSKTNKVLIEAVTLSVFGFFF